jgi:sporulation protein YunB
MFITFFVFTLAFSILAFIILEKNLNPTLIAIAEAKARTLATITINKGIEENVAKSISYEDLVTIRTNLRGEVSYVQPNTMEINRIASQTAIFVQLALEELVEEDIKIPLGLVLGSQLLANVGPEVGVKILPIGTVEVDIKEDFIDAGINQTRHRVILVITAHVQIIIPLVSRDVVVKSHVPLAETIIVGNVPNTIINFNPRQ